MGIKIITGPETEPLTEDEAKLHLRVDATDEDTPIARLIVTARQEAENRTGRALITQTLELGLDCWPESIRLPRPPLVSVSSIKYLDAAGALQTLDPSDYLVDNYREPGRIVPAYGKAWPLIRHQPNAILVRYVAGYGAASDVPAAIKNWMLLKIGTMYKMRSDVMAGQISALPHADAMLDGYRFVEFG